MAIPFFFLKANLTRPEQVSWLDRVILEASAPVQYAAAKVAKGVSSVIQDYVWLVDVQRDNEQLRHRVARLRQEARTLRHQAAENQRLRDLLNLRSHLRNEAITAHVIGREVSPLFRVVRLRLDRGQRHRVRAGMPVVSNAGLVGQVRRVSGRHSDVLLTVDRTSAVDVVVRPSGARGILRGTGETSRHAARIQYLSQADVVNPGDLVVTSGLGRRFPEGLVVGTVARVHNREFGMHQEVEVVPSVRFSSLDHVVVVTSGPRSEWSEGLP